MEAGGVLDAPELSQTDVLLETLMLGLRLAEGISLVSITQQFGDKTVERLWTALHPYYHNGWIEVVQEDGAVIDQPKAQKLPSTGRLRLSDPEGFLFSNTVLADLFKNLD
jgi:oxygen-independent coproporphyrinogen-3 oxidase